ncbi:MULTISPECIES: hypothetical protein [unclassified Sphingomonas]|uniref:hypothetical protein n=1 Tax=unclassified Sphingomonas TaxID=196159 RepID=UPI00226A9D7E|nr:MULTISPECIES: hypothetical protein [unclassified Sphingomonas]
MTDDAKPEPQIDPAAIDAEQIIPPEQVPMDDAAGGPQVHHDDEKTDVTASGAE